MIHARPSFSSFLPTLSLIGAFCAPVALASHNSGDREVRIVTVSGDVRLSPGDGKRPDLNRPWELAQRGDLVEQGASIATVDGRAEIEFEDGSTAYLAEKSLLSFSEISSGNKRITRMSLVTGSATFSLRPRPNGTLFHRYSDRSARNHPSQQVLCTRQLVPQCHCHYLSRRPLPRRPG